jgi:hypothetical protein
MRHFSCDLCSKDLTPPAARYVVKLEAFAAADPAELTEEDLDEDHVAATAQLLSEMEDADGDGPEELPASHKSRFDLCARCYRRYLKDPLGREAASRLDFSPN